jgi:hypothetical protein
LIELVRGFINEDELGYVKENISQNQDKRTTPGDKNSSRNGP